VTDRNARQGILNYLTGRSICQPPRSDGEAESLLARNDADVLRTWAAKIREVGIAKGWSVWASAYMDPDVPFTDTGMPSTETIVAELRSLDRASTLREAADAINALPQDYECDPGRGDAADLLRRMANEVEREKGTGGVLQPSAGEPTPASAESYASTDPQNCRLTIVPVVTSGRGPHVEFRGEDLSIEGEIVLVWLPIMQAKALDRALFARAGFEFADHSDDKLTVEVGDPWTVFTFARPSDAEEEAAVVRVIVHTGRLPELRRAIRAAITLAEQPTDYASRATGEPRTCAASDTTGETP
jgi:hypothetical protein